MRHPDKNHASPTPPSPSYRSAGRIALCLTKKLQGTGAQRPPTCSRAWAPDARPSTLLRVCCCWRWRCSYAMLANGPIASSGTWWAAAPGPSTLHPAEKRAWIARIGAPVSFFTVVHRGTPTSFFMATEGCVARGNATSCGHERLCVVSRYCEDSALCIGAHGTALGRSLSKHPPNKTL